MTQDAAICREVENFVSAGFSTAPEAALVRQSHVVWRRASLLQNRIYEIQQCHVKSLIFRPGMDVDGHTKSFDTPEDRNEGLYSAEVMVRQHGAGAQALWNHKKAQFADFVEDLRSLFSDQTTDKHETWWARTLERGVRSISPYVFAFDEEQWRLIALQDMTVYGESKLWRNTKER